MTYIKRDTAWEKLARQAYILKKKRKALQEQELLLIEELKKVSDFESSEGKYFRFQRIDRMGSVNNQQIYEDFHVDVEAYRKDESISAWKLFKY